MSIAIEQKLVDLEARIDSLEGEVRELRERQHLQRIAMDMRNEVESMAAADAKSKQKRG